MVTTITADEFREMVDGEASYTVIDTRPPESFDGWHVKGAINYLYKPFHEFDLEAFEAATDVGTEETIVTMCAKGKSSRTLGDELDDAGYTDVYFVEDGMRAWASVYDHVPIPISEDGATSPSVEIVQIQRRAKGCLGYLVVSGESAAAIDVSRHTDEWRTAAAERGATIEAVFDTHVHADHITGGPDLARELNVQYFLPAAADERGVAREFERLHRNEVVEIGGTDVKALMTPGHTSEMMGYLIGSQGVVTGDTLFVDAVGRTELQFAGGSQSMAEETTGAKTGAEKLYDSLHRTLLSQPDSLTVLPGHFSVSASGETGASEPGTPITTTIGDARMELPILRLDREAFIDRITAKLPEKPPNYETVIAINRGRERPADETEAIELELGPNRCAAEPDEATSAD